MTVQNIPKNVANFNPHPQTVVSFNLQPHPLVNFSHYVANLPLSTLRWIAGLFYLSLVMLVGMAIPWLLQIV